MNVGRLTKIAPTSKPMFREVERIPTAASGGNTLSRSAGKGRKALGFSFVSNWTMEPVLEWETEVCGRKADLSLYRMPAWPFVRRKH